MLKLALHTLISLFNTTITLWFFNILCSVVKKTVYFTLNILACVRFCCLNAAGRFILEHESNAQLRSSLISHQLFSSWSIHTHTRMNAHTLRHARAHPHTHSGTTHIHLWWRKPLCYITWSVGLNLSSPERCRSSRRLMGQYLLFQTWLIILIDMIWSSFWF